MTEIVWSCEEETTTTAPVRGIEAITVDGQRRRGRPKLRCEDRLKLDLKELQLSEDMISYRNSWRLRIIIEEYDKYAFWIF